METDEDIRELVRRLTPSPSVTVDLDEVRRRVRRRRTGRAVVAAAVSVGVVVGGVSAVTRGAGNESPTPAEQTTRPAPLASGWHSLPDMPLTPRWSPFTVWTGEEVLVMGGIRQDYVGGPAPFPSLREGAAYDPETSEWRAIAEAPVPVWDQSESVVVGDTVVVVSGYDWLSYDIADDEWRRLTAPDVRMPQPSLATTEGSPDLVYALDEYEVEAKTAPVQVLDLDTGDWSQLPRSPHLPTLDQRTLVGTPDGLVVMGGDYFPRTARKHHIENAHAEVWDGRTWRRFGDSEVQGTSWHWTGQRIISAYRVSREDSARGRAYRFRAGALDPDTGDWSLLPWLRGYDPRLLDGGWPVVEGPLAFSGGYLYDDATGSDEPVPKPDQSLQEPAVQIGDGKLLVVGGYRLAPGEDYGSRVVDVEPTNEAWIYVP